MVWLWLAALGLLAESSQALILDENSEISQAQISDNNSVELHPAVKDCDFNHSSLQDMLPDPKFGAPEPRYVGFCKNAHVYMWPGNSRKFWSFGYVDLKQNYPANCSLKYIFDTRAYPADPLAKFGFKVTGVFYGIPTRTKVSECYESDYLLLNDTSGVEELYCGAQSNVSFFTNSDYFELTFESQADSPTAKGFYVIIQSFRLCGGLLTPQFNGPRGVLESPLYPESYPPNLSCNWYFQSMSETAVVFSCEKFLLGERIPNPNPNGTEALVCSDSLSFTWEMNHPDDTMNYCSDELDDDVHTIYSLSTDLLVNFQTDDVSEANAGFKCYYEFILYAD